MMTAEEHEAEVQKFREQCEIRCTEMAKLKAHLKDLKIRNVQIASWCGCSPSNISVILNGNWPCYQHGGAPMYFEKWMASFREGL